MTKFLEVTHGQWLYWNLLVDTLTTGILDTKQKEEIQRAIEDQLELGGAGQEKEDKFQLQINLENHETTSSETPRY